MEKLRLDKMVAHVGKCEVCGRELVKMPRDTNGKLLPQNCWCLACGQRYFMEIPNLEEWEHEQWKQKAELQ